MAEFPTKIIKYWITVRFYSVVFSLHFLRNVVASFINAKWAKSFLNANPSTT